MGLNQLKKTAIIKFGGGLITNKSELKTPNKANMKGLATVVKSLAETYNIVIVHGAGSYGHLNARKYMLQEGEVTDFGMIDGLTQRDAVSLVRADMLELSNILVKIMGAEGISCSQFPPHKYANGTGIDFNIDIKQIQDAVGGTIPILWGDVVDCKKPKNFGILSGDDIAARLSLELENVTALIFAMGGADGIMTEIPDKPNSKLISEWNESTPFTSSHNSKQDVTGGIIYKAKRGSLVSSHVDYVYIVNGECPNRIISAIEGHETIGTRIRPS